MDLNPPQAIVALIFKHLQGELSPAEQQELEQWLAAAPENEDVFQQLQDPEVTSQLLILAGKVNPDENWGKFLPTIMGLPIERITRQPVRHLYRRIVAAACILAVLSGAYYYFLWRTKASVGKDQSLILASESRPILPGKNTAVLILDNGRQVLLDSVHNGTPVAVQNGNPIVRQNQVLKYDGSAQPRDKMTGAVVYNTLATPRAGQFELELSDGSHVWLNNASSLRYPTTFEEATRTVELTGEAYFSVAKKTGHPFQVKVGDLTIRVLGTEFNVMAYSDENAVRTTLVRGKVAADKKDHRVILQPGEQLAVSAAGDWSIRPVDTDEVIDWKNGLFHFDHADLPSVLRQLARWYDVEFVFQGAIPDKPVQGQIHRDLTLNQVLEILTDKDVHFVVRGRKIIVTPKL